ncbi:hypothetical protein PENSPDRAFT_649526 [Peniophora sp. CONT]|nr:hypothetical protein PENSPDRAFT_649526 [Peniophora sp. CONT]
MASLARQLALRSQILTRASSVARVSQNARLALARYYSTPSSNNAGSAPRAETSDNAAKLSDPKYLAELDRRFAEAFPYMERANEMPAEVKAEILGKYEALQGENPELAEELMDEKYGEDWGEGELDASLAEIKHGRFERNLHFPDLSLPEPIYDLKETLPINRDPRSPYTGTVTIRNDPSIFLAQARMRDEIEARHGRPSIWDDTDPEIATDIAEEQRAIAEGRDLAKDHPWEKDESDSASKASNVAWTPNEIRNLKIYRAIDRRVVKQSGKGKIARRGLLIIVGNGNGLVGYGNAKNERTEFAIARAKSEALRTMDFVDRFEGRTIWTEMHGKLGATRIILRPRPVGFGLHCNPNIHRICTAAGIKDISAKVWGSRNPINVIKLTFRMLQSGAAPHAMGDGIGGSGHKLDKGQGVRGKQELQRERGRKIRDLVVR